MPRINPNDFGAANAGGPPASEKQRTFIRDLIAQVLPADQGEAALEKLRDMESRGALTVGRASKWIDRLLELRRTSQQQVEEYGTRTGVRDYPDVPAGRYAVDGDDGLLKFYRVDRPEEGRWAGYTFVKVQAGGEYHRLPSKSTELGVLRKIAADVRGAAVRYGRELGTCSRCGRELTKNISRELAIGPVCGKRLFGDEFSAEVRTARESLRERGVDPDANYEPEDEPTERGEFDRARERGDEDAAVADLDRAYDGVLPQDDPRVCAPDGLECLDSHPGEGGQCEGPVEYRMPLSGTGRSFPRCEKHWESRLDFQQHIMERYPETQPSDFDPAYAGERWDED